MYNSKIFVVVMILNEVLWIILGVICILQLPCWLYCLGRRVLYVRFQVSFSFDKVFNQKKKKKKKRNNEFMKFLWDWGEWGRGVVFI